MRVEIRKRPYDLYGVMGASVLLMMVLVLTPNTTVLRVILGLPFILFFPGYVLISALYPEKQKVVTKEDAPFDREQGSSDPTGDSDTRKPTKYERRQARRRRKEERERTENGMEEDDEERVRTRGIDGLERAALSLGLSVAITPLIGLVLSFTYDWDPQNLGLRLVPIFASQFLFIMILGGAAVWRRSRIPLDKRFGITIDVSMQEDHTTGDKVLTAGIVIMMILSVSLLIYIIAVPRDGESFTEFYVLGISGIADDYPRYMHASTEKGIIIGITNHEHKARNYTLVGMIGDGADNDTIGSFDHISLTADTNPSMAVLLGDGDTIEMFVNFTINEIGHHKLRFYLFLDGEEYRSIHIWVKVFDGETLGSVGSSGDLSYLAGLDGDPATLLDPYNENFLGISINYHRSTEKDMDVTLRLNISVVGSYAEPVPYLIYDGQDAFYLPGGNLTESEGLVLEMHVNATEIGQPLLIGVPDGDWYLTVRVISPSGVCVHTVFMSVEGN